MDVLRPWALWAALVAILLALLACVGAGFLISPPPLEERIAALIANPAGAPEGISITDLAQLSADAFDEEAADPPGLGIPYLALVNGLLLLILAFMALPLVLGARAMAVVNGVVNLIGGIIAALSGILLAILAFVALITMVSLFLAAPFGTLAYLAVFGFFDTGTAGAVLGLVMFLQLAAVVLLVVAQQRVLTNKRLLFFLLLTIVLTFLTMLLHSIVPIILVSITDALAALVTAIVAIIWGVAILIGGIISLVKQLNLGRQGSTPLRTREATERLDGATGAAPGQPAGGTTLTAHVASPTHLITSRVSVS